MHRIRDLLSRLQAWWNQVMPGGNGQPRAEPDVAADTAVARSRAHGGPEPQQAGGDAATTTGTAGNDLFVGRVAGEDIGYAEETGAEARSSGSTERDSEREELGHGGGDSGFEPLADRAARRGHASG